MNEEYFLDKNTQYAYTIGLWVAIMLHGSLWMIIGIPIGGIIAHKINKKWPNGSKISKYKTKEQV